MSSFLSPGAKGISCANSGADCKSPCSCAFTYSFFGAVCHSRNHYWTEVKHNNEYFECNDTKVRKLIRKQPHPNTATIVAYERNLIAPLDYGDHAAGIDQAVTLERNIFDATSASGERVLAKKVVVSKANGTPEVAAPAGSTTAAGAFGGGATMNTLVSKIFGNTLTCVGNDGSVAAADGEGRATDLIDLSKFYSDAEGNCVDIEGSPPAAAKVVPPANEFEMLGPVLTPSVVATQGSLNKSKNVPNQS